MSQLPLFRYLDSVGKLYQTGIAKEHAYRGDFRKLVMDLHPDLTVVNEPSVSVDCGNPDFVFNKGNIPIGYVEAKDINKDLNSKVYQEQFNRYLNALDNLIITDYLWFKFYRNGELYEEIRIANVVANRIVAVHESFDQFENLLRDFCTHIGQTIKSATVLAKLMAGKARLLESTIEKALLSDEITHDNSTLLSQLDAFKEVLIHDITPKQFADVYAQTITYGMFAARLHDTTLDTFSREEAASLIPKTNPFLRKLFQYIAGYDIDPRIKLTVDNLAEVFRSTDVAEILKSFNRESGNEDPIIHFYETFLTEYDPKLRKSRGVWYTPQPVVNFIVRAVDDILKDEFELPMGIADTSTTNIKVNTTNIDKRSSTGYKQIEKEVHRVQILDPATGTGTFLAEIINNIYNNHFKTMQGAWSKYVDEHLIPRLNGFEILMASYSMAHLKLDLLLQETGYKSTMDQRFKIYLTNSLEEYHKDTGTLFANWLSTEANEANHIKRDSPVMVVMGNPPYSVSSTNKNEWIDNLMLDYKKNLDDKNIQPLSDDYLKFIRYGQYLIEKNGEGVLAYISNNSFIDSVIHRQMRKHLLETFDKIYILDLHGSIKKNETADDGSKDENVFDIQQGVSINIFIKNNKHKSGIYKMDISGKREIKYKYLLNNSIHSIKWNQITPKANRYYFKEINSESYLVYQNFISINNLFIQSGAGVQTKRDNIFIDIDKESLIQRIKSILNKNLSESEENILNIKNSSSYKLLEKIEASIYVEQHLRTYNYRVFDDRNIYYDKNLIGRAFFKTMQHMLFDNISLLTCKQQSSFNFQHSFITNQITDHNSISLQTSEATHAYPLYLIPENTAQTSLDLKLERTPNLKNEIVRQIAEIIGLTYTNEKEITEDTFAPIDILDYIYAILHSPTYREKYKEFLKIDFPRVPYPKNKDTFWKLVKLGGEIRQIHLLESPTVDKTITTYPIDGDNMVTKPIYQEGIVYINDTQYFDNVPTIAWEFYIGGYQPAQKWLKDRKGRTLSYEDIRHYQRIIVALVETDRLMKEIDKIDFLED